jgi:hypothetical protein
MATAPTRSVAATSPSTKRAFLSELKTTGSGAPGRWGIYGTEGVGKTTLATHFPKPIFLQSNGETGLETLLDTGRVADTAYLPACQKWDEALGIISELRSTNHGYQTLVVDTANGLEALCHAEVCRRDFAGLWGGEGFESYMKGYRVALKDWTILLNELDNLRHSQRMTIVLLMHCSIKEFKNPLAANYDRYVPAMHHETWALTLKWLDACVFVNFETAVKTDKATAKKGKGMGGTSRVMYCERTAGWDAKNRHGLPAEIDLGETPDEAWAAFSTAIKEGRKKGGE